MDKYAELVRDAGAEYAAAREVSREAHEKLAVLNGELRGVQEELGSLRERLGAFEAGRLVMSEEEFAAGLDRQRWLEGRARGLGGLVKAAAGPAREAGGQLTNVAAVWRTRLGALLQEDVAALRAQRIAELEEVLRG